MVAHVAQLLGCQFWQPMHALYSFLRPIYNSPEETMYSAGHETDRQLRESESPGVGSGSQAAVKALRPIGSKLVPVLQRQSIAGLRRTGFHDRRRLYSARLKSLCHGQVLLTSFEHPSMDRGLRT